MVSEDSDYHYRDLFDNINFNDTFFSNINESAIIRDYGVTTTFLRGTGILLLRAGLILIQFGCVPSTNVNEIILQNIIDLSCATIAFCTVGYVFAFGNDIEGIIGWGNWILDDAVDLDNAVLGWSCVVAITGIYITMVAGRMYWFGNLLVTTVLATVVIPIIIHWMWTSSGWMHKAIFRENLVSYKDYGGGMIIHACGGTVALIGCLFLGRRLLKLQNIGDASVSANSPASVTVGYLFLIIGLMGECLPTPNYELHHEPYNYIAITFLNNIIAAAGGIITVVLLQTCISRELSQYWTLLQYLQGAVAGIAIVASGVDVYSPIVALALGILGAFIYYWVAYLIFNVCVEDYINITATHLSCGLIGSVMPPLFGKREGFGVPHKVMIHFVWQLICDLAILSFVSINTIIIFFLVYIFNLLRNKDEENNHDHAMVVLAQIPNRRLCRRLLEMEQLLQPTYRFKREAHETNHNTSVEQNVTNVTFPQRESTLVFPSSSKTQKASI